MCGCEIQAASDSPKASTPLQPSLQRLKNEPRISWPRSHLSTMSVSQQDNTARQWDKVWGCVCLTHGKHTSQLPFQRLREGKAHTQKLSPLPGSTPDRRPRPNYRTAKFLVPAMSPIWSQKPNQDREED